LPAFFRAVVRVHPRSLFLCSPAFICRHTTATASTDDTEEQLMRPSLVEIVASAKTRAVW
jgi:hypothetical protein